MPSTSDGDTFCPTPAATDSVKEPQRAIVLFSGSDGSSWLCDMLGRQDSIFQLAFEPFCSEESWAPDIRAKLLEALIFGNEDAARASFPVALPNDSDLVDNYGERWREAKVTFFKSRLNEIPPELTSELMQRTGVKIIHLSRRNKLKQAISHVRRTTRGISHFNFDALQPAVDLPFDKIEAAGEHFTNREAANIAYLAESDVPYISVFYEELLKNPEKEIRKILKFLGIDPGELTTGSYFSKVTSDELTSAVIDYTAFAEHFSKTSLSHYL